MELFYFSVPEKVNIFRDIYYNNYQHVLNLDTVGFNP